MEREKSCAKRKEKIVVRRSELRVRKVVSIRAEKLV